MVTTYTERLTPKPAVLIAAAVFGVTLGLLGLAFSMAATLAAIIIVGLSLPIALWALSPVVRVTEAGSGPTGIELQCGRAHIDLAHLGDTEILSEEDLHDRIGLKSSGRDFVCFSPWVKTGVAIENIDETDPISTWVVCSRHPDRLSDALKKHTPSR